MFIAFLITLAVFIIFIILGIVSEHFHLKGTIGIPILGLFVVAVFVAIIILLIKGGLDSCAEAITKCGNMG